MRHIILNKVAGRDCEKSLPALYLFCIYKILLTTLGKREISLMEYL